MSKGTPSPKAHPATCGVRRKWEHRVMTVKEKATFKDGFRAFLDRKGLVRRPTKFGKAAWSMVAGGPVVPV